MKAVKTYSPYTRILSLVLSFLIVFYVIPITVFAENSDEDTSNVEDFSITNEENYTYAPEIYEVTELRESNVKHFRLEDGSYVAAQYNYPVHYVDENGQLVDINNRLEEGSGGIFANQNSRVSFVKKITGSGKLFTLSEDDTKIDVSILNANKGISGTVQNSSDAAEDTELHKKMNLENLSSIIAYKNVFDGVDIEYTVHSLNVKENIIVKEKSESYKYSFEIKLKNLTPQLTDSGDILLYDDNKNTKYIIPAPYVIDAEYSEAPKGVAYYSLSDDGNKYTLSIIVDSEWMNAEERFFPVNIDPVIKSVSAENAVQDITISTKPQETELLIIASENAAVYYQVLNLPNIYDGIVADARINLIYHSSVDRCFPSIKMHEVITAWDEQTLCLSAYNAGQGLINEHIVDYEVGKNPKLKYDFDVTELCKKWYDNPSCNHGVAFTRYITENEDQILTGAHLSLPARFYSSESASLNIPFLQISYVQMRGLESYWTYSSHSVGVGGTANINLANGSIVTTIPLLSTTDSLLPYTTALVYDSYFANKSVIYGDNITSKVTYLPYGYRLNMHELIFKNTFGESTIYSYIDADGTEHIFRPSATNPSVYYDDDGLRMVLTVNASSVITITDDSKTRKTFAKISSSNASAWHLQSIIDQNGNQIYFTFDHKTIRYTKVSLIPKNSLVEIDFLELRYNVSGRLAMIYNVVSKDAVVLRYSDSYYNSSGLMLPNGNYLSRIDYAHGNDLVTDSDWEAFIKSYTNTSNITIDDTAIYTYDSSGRITDIRDVNAGQRLRLAWQNKKISRIGHFSEDQLGQSLIYSYGEKYTDVTNSGSDDIIGTGDDISTRYVFDNRARTISTYSYAKDGSEIYGAVVGKYETQYNVQNNLHEQTVLGGSYTNYILNGGFEESNSATVFGNWTTSGTVDRTTSSFDRGEGYVARLTPEANSTSSLCQWVTLEEGTYTLSFDYSSCQTSGINAQVTVSSISESMRDHIAVIPLSENVQNTTSSTFSTSFNVTAGGDYLIITISAEAGNNVDSNRDIQIDSVMLSKQSGTPRYTLVEYGTFEESAIDSSRNRVPINNYWSTTNYVTTEDVGGIFGKALKISANSGTQYASQRVYESEGGDTQSSNTGQYLVSGFAKAPSAMSGDGLFRIRVDVSYYQGEGISDVVKSFYYDFATGCDAWQFTGGLLDTQYIPLDESDENSYNYVSAIDVICEYSNQPNGDAYFDNISITRIIPTDSQKYYYYESGLLAKKSSFFDSEYYEYDSNGNLVRLANDDGEIIGYSYDIYDRLTCAIYSTFTVISDLSTKYPFGYANIDEYIEKITKRKTLYSYNSYGQIIKEEVFASGSNSKTIANCYAYDTTEGSRTFGALISETDSTGTIINYYYDESDGKLLATINQSAGTGVCYTYDESDKLTAVTPATYVESEGYSATQDAERVSYMYESNRLSSISTESTTYTFTYDAFGNALSSKAGNNTLATYEYNDYNGKLIKITYSNDFSVEYSYNSIEKLSEVWYTDSEGVRTLAYEYEYNAYGNISKFVDNISGRISEYIYDSSERLVSFKEYDLDDYVYDFSTDVSYDESGRVSEVFSSIDYLYGAGETARTFSSRQFTYAANGRLEQMSLSTPTFSNNIIQFGYDNFNRLSSKVSSFGGFTHTDSYTYVETESRTSPTQVHIHTSKVNDNASTVTRYTYDSKGNITKIITGSQEIRYAYDDLGQLVREDNVPQSRTYVYTYDNAGNIKTKKTYELTAEGVTPTSLFSIDSYSYGDHAWGDKLTAYKGQTITYDEIGNPLSYYNGSSYTFTWTGRRLTGAVKDSSTMSFTYNDEGIRTSKTVNGVTYKYYLDGSNIIAEVTDKYTMVYIYGENGTPIGMQYREPTYAKDVWDTFWYEKNLQGDIVAIYNASGTKLASYNYDTWGNHTVTCSNPVNRKIAYANLFRYRGYYYDSHLRLYYLNFRYYDSNIGRFISPDDDSYLGANGDLTNHNLYAYCNNNPINYVDPSGHFVISTLLLIVTGVAALTTIVALTYASATEETIALDLSYTDHTGFKVGGSLLLDFENSNIELYPHIGYSKGMGSGATYSVGKVLNYDGPGSYAGFFAYTGFGNFIGVDGCFNPLNPSGPSAISTTFSYGVSAYCGMDWYFEPISFNYKEGGLN